MAKDKVKDKAEDKVRTTGSIKSYIIRRFGAIASVVVAVDIFLVNLEDWLFGSLLAAYASDVAHTTSREALVWAIQLIAGFFRGSTSSLLTTGDLLKVALLLAFMIILLVIPIAIGALVFARMTEKRISAEQKARDEERAQFYQRRNLMVSDMAHDLRTPVMSISGLAQALSDGMVTDEETQERYLHSISAKSEKMADLVNILFDYVQLDSEGYSLDRKPLDLPQLMLQEAAAAYTDVEDAGMFLQMEVSETPLSIVADERQMGRVIANLIANAVRHNDKGTVIMLGLGRRAGVGDIIVADTGRPIEQDVNELFEPFAKGDMARSGGGSGLGLSIVKTIVDMHGYQIQLFQPYGGFTKAFVVTCAVED